VSALLLWPGLVAAEPVDVRYTEGSLHGFLVVRATDGKVSADGDAIQTVRGDQVTAHVVFHFRDGSLQDETTVYSQRRQFQLVSYRLVQKGPTFPQPLEMSVDGLSGQVSVRYLNEKGEQKVESEHFDVPPDLANGMITTLLKNARANALPKSVSVIAATPKPRLVKLLITPAGQEPFSIAGSRRQAMHYVLKVQIGGIAGVLAPVVGEKPPDSHVWIFPGEVPAFVKAEQPLYAGSPLWRIELAGPAWPPTPALPKLAEDRTSLPSPPQRP
jgi:hypothetical protein